VSERNKESNRGRERDERKISPTEHHFFVSTRVVKEHIDNSINNVISEPPGWHSGLGHCIAVLAVPPENLGLSPGSVASSRDREVHGVTHYWPSVVWFREGLAGCLITH
jgi:hypothetical protein